MSSFRRKGLPRTRPLEVRFWEKVDMGMGCWLWIGQLNANGYGKIHRGGPVSDMQLAHRVSWELHFGPIPVGLYVCHRCDVASCVCPSHLFLGTQKENMQDAKRKGRTSTGATHNTGRGETHHAAKLSDIAVADIRARAKRRTRPSGPAKPGEPWARLADEYGVSVATISNVVHGRSWKRQA